MLGLAFDLVVIWIRKFAMSDVIAGKNLKKTNNWKRSLAVCTPTKIFLYDNEQDKSNKAFSLAIDINKVDSVRPMEHGELWRISAKNVPRLFRISFFSDDRTAADLDVSVVSGYFFSCTCCSFIIPLEIRRTLYKTSLMIVLTVVFRDPHSCRVAHQGSSLTDTISWRCLSQTIRWTVTCAVESSRASSKQRRTSVRGASTRCTRTTWSRRSGTSRLVRAECAHFSSSQTILKPNKLG